LNELHDEVIGGAGGVLFAGLGWGEELKLEFLDSTRTYLTQADFDSESDQDSVMASSGGDGNGRARVSVDDEMILVNLSH
jgi:hypothetical protein